MCRCLGNRHAKCDLTMELAPRWGEIACLHQRPEGKVKKLDWLEEKRQENAHVTGRMCTGMATKDSRRDIQSTLMAVYLE